MKALLIKDLYMAKRYCRSYLLIVGIFLLVSVFNPGQNLFFLAYPCVLAGMVSTTLLSFDERMGWTSYCGCLPFTKGQLVGEKYLLGLIVELVVWVVSLVCLALGITVLVAKVIGCTLPMIAKKFGFDPAVMASPFITTAVDAVSLLVYFFIATALLKL